MAPEPNDPQCLPAATPNVGRHGLLLPRIFLDAGRQGKHYGWMGCAVAMPEKNAPSPATAPFATKFLDTNSRNKSNRSQRATGRPGFEPRAAVERNMSVTPGIERGGADRVRCGAFVSELVGSVRRVGGGFDVPGRQSGHDRLGRPTGHALDAALRQAAGHGCRRETAWPWPHATISGSSPIRPSWPTSIWKSSRGATTRCSCRGRRITSATSTPTTWRSPASGSSSPPRVFPAWPRSASTTASRPCGSPASFPISCRRTVAI